MARVRPKSRFKVFMKKGGKEVKIITHAHTHSEAIRNARARKPGYRVDSSFKD